MRQLVSLSCAAPASAQNKRVAHILLNWGCACNICIRTLVRVPQQVFVQLSGDKVNLVSGKILLA